MTADQKAPEAKPAAPERPAFGPPPRRGPGGMFGGMGMPAEKSLNFRPSLKRLLGRMRGERIGLALVLLLGVAVWSSR